jgi:hypothetical protein
MLATELNDPFVANADRFGIAMMFHFNKNYQFDKSMINHSNIL